MSASEDGTKADAPADSKRNRFWGPVLEVFAFVAPTSFLTGTLYYFGLVSARAYYSYFGVSLSALDLSTTSYVVRSTDTVFKPAATLLLILVALFGVHHLLNYTLGQVSRSWARGVALGLCIIGAIAAGIGLLGLYGEPRGLWSPISLAASGLLLEYGLWTASKFGNPPPRIAAVIDAGVYLRRGLIAAMVFIATFWAITNLAQARGVANARLAELSLRLQSQAVVYSEKDLQLPGPEVGVTVLQGKDSAYRFRYNGLRPLLYSNDRWFLLPVGWTHDNGSTVIVLEDEPSRIRVDLAP
jgi:hypothetical protein